jgi:hypothetical protein
MKKKKTMCSSSVDKRVFLVERYTAQYAVRSQMKKKTMCSSSVDKRVFLLECYKRYVQSESFKISDCSHRFVKQFRQTGNVNKPKRVRQSTAVTETPTAEVREGLT